VSEIAQRSLDAIGSPDRRNRWRLNLHLRTDGRCTDSTGQYLPDAIRRYLTCDGMLTPTFFDNGIPVSVGRSQHIVPDRTRRVVIERDGGCIVPGCHVTHHLEVHHIIHWDDDGPSDSWNLIALRLSHESRLSHPRLGLREKMGHGRERAWCGPRAAVFDAAVGDRLAA
jgi:HNH endonuclease